MCLFLGPGSKKKQFKKDFSIKKNAKTTSYRKLQDCNILSETFVIYVQISDFSLSSERTSKSFSKSVRQTRSKTQTAKMWAKTETH